jgi:hypothetical protein
MAILNSEWRADTIDNIRCALAGSSEYELKVLDAIITGFVEAYRMGKQNKKGARCFELLTDLAAEKTAN